MLDVVNSLVSQATTGSGTLNGSTVGGATANSNPWFNLYQNTLGRAPTQAELNRWGNGSTITPQQMDKFLGEARNEAVNTMPKTGAVGNIAQQILAQGNTAQWSGEGYGSPEKTAYDMAVMLAGQGITDINQLGKITKTIPAHQVDDPEYGSVNIPEQTVSFFGNKETGQEISPYYDKAGQVGADIWGGTFKGEGSTAYGVSFDASGKPTIYSKYGGSSSNLSDYTPLLLAGAAFGAPFLGELLSGAGAAGAGTLGGLGDLGAMGALGEGVGAGAGLGAGTAAGTAAGTGATLASLGDLGTMGALGGEGALAGGAGSVAGMGAGTGLTAAGTGAGGLGGAMSTLGGEAALGSGLTTAGAGAGTMGALGGEAALGTGVGAGAGAIGSNLGTTLAGTSTLPVGTTLANLGAGAGGSLLGAGAGSALGAGAGSALGTSLATGLGLNALGGVLGAAANQSGISNARDLINQYGTKAYDALQSAYGDQKGVYAGNRADLLGNFATAKGDLASALASQRGIYDTTNTNLANTYANTQNQLGNVYNQQVGFQQPYQAVGQSAAQGLIANQPYFTHQFDVNDLNTNLAPNYAFQLQQGQMANQRAANMGGGSLGGNALQGLQRYTQDYAGNAYQQAFNNYNQQRNNIYNSLAGMANIGTTSGGQLAGLGSNYGSTLGGLSSAYGGNMVSNTGQMQGAYNQYGSNLTNLNTNLANNLTSAANAMQTAAGLYGGNQASLATGIGGALAGNATASGANTATALSNLGNTALLGSMLKAT